MASESVSLANGGGKKISSTWAWVDKLDNKVDNLATNAEKISGTVDKIGDVIGSLFGSKKESASKQTSVNLADFLPLVAVGGLMAFILK